MLGFLIKISFYAVLAEWLFMHRFRLIPSLGMIDRGVVGCQIELKPAEGGREAADKTKRAGNPADLTSQSKGRL